MKDESGGPIELAALPIENCHYVGFGAVTIGGSIITSRWDGGQWWLDLLRPGTTQWNTWSNGVWDIGPIERSPSGRVFMATHHWPDIAIRGVTKDGVAGPPLAQSSQPLWLNGLGIDAAGTSSCSRPTRRSGAGMDRPSP